MVSGFVGILSLNINTDDLNYGAMLHSWAFQQYLFSKNVNNEIIDYTTKKFEGKDLSKPYSYLIKEKRVKSFLISILRQHSFSIRYSKFADFIRRNMVISKTKYNQHLLNNSDLLYDTVVCESDVIWDPNFFDGAFDHSFFLVLDSMKEKKRIAYSASIGNMNINLDQEKELINLVSNLDFISCRETYATSFINERSSLNATCVLDPVLLLLPSDYDSITAPRVINEKYIVLYTPVGYDYRIIKEAKRIAKENNFKLIEISLFPWDSFDHKTICDAGVEEFLSLLKNAEIVLTNSFHAVCFSILFQKEFYVFPRETGKKTEDFCLRLGLEKRIIREKLLFRFPVDYSRVNPILDLERKKSENFLLSSLGISGL